MRMAKSAYSKLTTEKLRYEKIRKEESSYVFKMNRVVAILLQTWV